MKTYTYFSIADPNQEPINKIKTSSLDEATQIFSEMKKLTVEEFTNIYDVVQYGEETN